MLCLNNFAVQFVQVFACQLCRLFRLVTPIDCSPTSAGADDESANPLNERLTMLGYRDPEEAVENFIKANTKRKKRKM